MQNDSTTTKLSYAEQMSQMQGFRNIVEYSSEH